MWLFGLLSTIAISLRSYFVNTIVLLHAIFPWRVQSFSISIKYIGQRCSHKLTLVNWNGRREMFNDLLFLMVRSIHLNKWLGRSWKKKVFISRIILYHQTLHHYDYKVINVNPLKLVFVMDATFRFRKFLKLVLKTEFLAAVRVRITT